MQTSFENKLITLKSNITFLQRLSYNKSANEIMQSRAGELYGVSVSCVSRRVACHCVIMGREALWRGQKKAPFHGREEAFVCPLAWGGLRTMGMSSCSTVTPTQPQYSTESFK